MSHGTVEEFDHPHLLLQRPDSHLRQLVEQSGPTERQALEDIARAAYKYRKATTLEHTEDSGT